MEDVCFPVIQLALDQHIAHEYQSVEDLTRSYADSQLARWPDENGNDPIHVRLEIHLYLSRLPTILQGGRDQLGLKLEVVLMDECKECSD